MAMTRRRSSLARGCAFLLPATALFALGGCSSASEPPLETRVPARIVAVASLPPTVTVMTQVPTRPSVRVLDQFGAPFAGASVRFRVTAGEGVVLREWVVADEQGVATADWIMGPRAGSNALVAQTVALTPVQFSVTATAGAPARLQQAQGDWQVAPPATRLPRTLRARVVDLYDNPVSGVVVTFAVSTGNGTLDVATATTDTAGYADAGQWTLGPSLGTQLVLARAGELVAEFSAQAYTCTDGDRSLWCARSWRLLAVLGDGQIYRMNVDGSGLTQLTTTGEQRSPVVSPDGRRIAFARKLPGGTSDVYVMNNDGTNVVRLTTGMNFYAISWAPDSRRLAMSDNGLYESSTYVLDIDSPGSALTMIAGRARAPAWSPDGSRIAFVQASGDDGYDALAIMRPDGTGQTLLSGRDGARYGVSWTRDGRVSAVHCNVICELSTVNVDGTSTGNIGIPPGLWNVATSPDGLSVAYSRRSATGSLIGLLVLDGTQTRTIVGEGFDVSWTP